MAHFALRTQPPVVADEAAATVCLRSWALGDKRQSYDEAMWPVVSQVVDDLEKDHSGPLTSLRAEVFFRAVGLNWFAFWKEQNPRQRAAAIETTRRHHAKSGAPPGVRPSD